MKVIDELLYKPCEWLKGTGPKANVVISSRIRLARNIEGLPFLYKASPQQKEEILERVKDAVSKSKFLKGSNFIRLKNISKLDRQFLVERHLMSPEHMADVEYKALIIDDKEIVSIMVNEEDHLRLQVLQSGFNLVEAWRMADEIDSDLSKRLEFAFSTRWGYLTACPTNTGTGFRGSVMLHMPALVITGQIDRVVQAVSKLGLTIRGFYGEGTEAIGNFFQISNQVTLGRSEQDLIDNIDKIINKILSREFSTRTIIMTKNKTELTDRIWRAFGTLKSARIINSSETIKLISTIRLGIDLGIVKDIDMGLVNELFIMTQPAHLQKMEKRELTASERDLKRADIVRQKLTRK
jgi:protein arginine kinase